MKMAFNRGHSVTLSWEPENGDKLLSPDKTQHFLPCEWCLTFNWVSLSVVSYVCDCCSNGEGEGILNS